MYAARDSLPRVPVVADLDYLIHWPTHGGYNFVSGPLADITLATAFFSALYLWWRKHNCHVHRCCRLQWHPHPDHGHPGVQEAPPRRPQRACLVVGLLVDQEVNAVVADGSRLGEA